MSLRSPFIKIYNLILARTSKFLDRNLLKNGDTYDKTLVWVLLCLLCFGLVMVYSASGAQAGLRNYDNRTFFLIKQVNFALFGLLTCFIAMRIPMWRWQRWAKFFLVFCLMLLLLLPFVGDIVNGARRWLITPIGIKIQPSELFKLATILYMADFFKRKLDILYDYRRAGFVSIPIVLGGFLISLTRDLGSVVVIAGISLCLLFLANMPRKWFWSAVGGAICAVVLLIATSEFRMRRVAVMWQPWKDPTGTGYQGLGSLLSLGRGGLFGEGLGNGIIKRGFLPEAHTDFILAVISEELGLMTVALLAFVYLWLIWRAFSIGKQAKELDLHFNFFIAVGIGLWITMQCFINIGVNVSLLPNKGLTLPLISYGGSSLVVMLLAFTILLRIDYENRRKIRGFCVADPKEKNQQKVAKK